MSTMLLILPLVLLCIHASWQATAFTPSIAGRSSLLQRLPSPQQEALSVDRFPGKLPWHQKRRQRGRLTSSKEDVEAGSLDSAASNSDREFLRNSLLQSILVSNLPPQALQVLLNAFERVEYSQNEIIYQQGESCQEGYVYVVQDGQCSAQMDGKEVPRPYGILKPTTLFGELGILYNQTRATTVSCRTTSVRLWRVPGDVFKTVLNQRVDDTIPAVTIGDNSDTEAAIAAQTQEIDNAIQQIEGTKSLYEGAIIRPYKPHRSWLWRRFRGTILQHVAIPTLLNMLWAILVVVWARHGTGLGQTIAGVSGPPDPSHPWIVKLHMVHKIWCYQQGLTTFILTFFLNQAFLVWREIYTLGRKIQGRLNDFHYILATTAARQKTNGAYTPKAEVLLDNIGQMSRLFHVLFWAAHTQRFAVLGTPRGLKRMASRGLLTTKQLNVLESLDLPQDQKHSACLEWMMIRTDQGIQDGSLVSDPAHRQMLLGVMSTLRCTYASISDQLDGRMPLAYTHFVQVLVDTFVWTAPLALYSELGAWSVICVGVLTLFYTGLLDLAKIFLDPLNNEEFCRNSIYMDIGVLIRESNAGSTRWMNGAARLPF